MQLAIALDGPAALEQQDDFKGLKVVVDPAEQLSRVVGLLSAVEADEADHLWIPADTLRDLAVRSADWDSAFDAMLAKVEPYGWYDAATGRVKAHVEHAA
jgi:hypothetical protein